MVRFRRCTFLRAYTGYGEKHIMNSIKKPFIAVLKTKSNNFKTDRSIQMCDQNSFKSFKKEKNKPEQAKVRLSMIVQWKIQKIQFKTGFCTSKSQAISKITQKPEFVFGEVTQPFYIIIKPEFLSGGSHNFLYSHKSITSLWDFTQLQIKEMTLSIWTDQKKEQ